MLPRAARLRKNRDFQAVYRVRRSWATPHLVLYVRALPGCEPGRTRLGFVISKKIAKRAHDRNRLKRRLREICRAGLASADGTGRSWDALFVARASAPALDFSQLVAEVRHLTRRAGLWE